MSNQISTVAGDTATGLIAFGRDLEQITGRKILPVHEPDELEPKGYRIVSPSRGEQRPYTYQQWEKFFQAAIRRGICAREDLAREEIRPLGEQTRRNPRLYYKLDAHFMRAMMIETYRQVRDGKRRGLSPWNLWNEMNNRADRARQERLEKDNAERKETARRRQEAQNPSGRRRRISEQERNPLPTSQADEDILDKDQPL